MTFEKAIEYALTGKALLFLGAGFSRMAINLLDVEMGDAKELSYKLCRKMGIKENEDLSKVSNHYLRSESSSHLISLLRDEFKCKSIKSKSDELSEETYKAIVDINWNEVYTTNYDDVYETTAKLIGKKVTPVTLSDNPRQYSKNEIVVHINGYIDKLTKDTLKSEFKLTKASYNTEDFIDSNWKGLFVHALKSCKAIFFIGTSLDYDLDITRIINTNPDLKEKIFFIDRFIEENDRDELDTRLDYGEVMYIGLHNFVKKINEVKSSFNSTESEIEFDCFTKVRPSIFSYQNVSTEDYWSLLVYGDIQNNIAFSNIDNNDYLFNRKQKHVLQKYIEGKDEKIVVIHSDIGNGKTSFVKKCSMDFCKKSDVYVFNGLSKSFYEEINYIRDNVEKPIIFVEDYYDHWKVIDYLSCMINEDTKIILSGRSYVHLNRLKELTSRLSISQDDVIEIDLNRLSEDEIFSVNNLLDKINVWEKKGVTDNRQKKKYIKKDMKSKLYNILLDLVNSKEIKRKIDEVFKNVNSNQDLREILSAICINSILNLGLCAHDIVEYLDIKNFDHMLRVNENVRTLINWEENKIEFKSPILAKYFSSEKISKKDLISTVKKLALYANRNNYDEKSEIVSKKLISVSNLQMISLNNIGNAKSEIIEVFDNLSEFETYKNRPFFWLQYGIACMDAGVLDRTEHYLDIAYKKGEEWGKKKGLYLQDTFDTFQIDTQKGRFYLESILQSKILQDFIPKINKAHILFVGSIKSKYQSERYVIKQLKIYTKIWNKHKENINGEEKKYLLSIVKKSIKLCDDSNFSNDDLKKLERTIIKSVSK